MPIRDLDPRLIDQLQRSLDTSVARAESVTGGDIHQAFRIYLGDERTVFVKTSAHTSPGLFSAEAAGLRWLAGFGAIQTPHVLAHREQDAHCPGFLALNWLAHGRATELGLRALGQQLATLHCHGQVAPGWSRASFIGSLPQLNGGEALSWPEFWAERRLREMLSHAGPRLPAQTSALVHQVCDHAADIIGTDRPLGPLHGDLWRGNVLFVGDDPVLIDPAVYVGDPEVDLAMMALFGGFGPAFWQAYHGELAIEAGSEGRRAMYQLWPLLVHVALFGHGYVAQVDAAARRALALV
ncbi:MAG: fructosamine kinase family protein [Myxococcales bacterium]|nr:fructosamine kinase family protein [Myxococcales bacterium]